MNKYLSLSSEPLKSSDIQRFEEHFGSLPEDYKSLLLRENGGVTRPLEGDDDLLFYSIAKGPNDLRLKWRECQPGVLMPIAETVEHQELLIDRNNGTVFFGGQIVADSISQFLSSSCETITYEEPVVDYIANRRHDDLERAIRAGLIKPDHLLEDGYTLPKYAVLVGNEKALEILAKHGFDFTGTLHFLLKIGMVTRPLIRAVLSGGVDLEEKNADGLKVTELNSPWLEDIIELSQEK